MNTTPRDFVTVDMRGLKGPLEARAIETGRSVSDLVRTAMGAWLGEVPHAGPVKSERAPHADPSTSKLSIRFRSADAEQLDARARQVGVSRGALIAGLLSGVPVMAQSTTKPAEVLSALVSSNAQVSSLGRQVSRLCLLLERGDGQAAREYRVQLSGLVAEVRSHLRLTAQALDLLRARRGRIEDKGRAS